MPNFTMIDATVWISIGYEYIYFVLYILDKLGLPGIARVIILK